MAKIGIYSGTFDPVHKGHLAVAQAARQVCNLDKVVFLPEVEPRHKPNVTSIKHRLVMLELALGGQPGLESAMLPSQQFSVAETLPLIRQIYPRDELYLLVGSDVVGSFATGWPDFDILLKNMCLVVALRQKDDVTKVKQALSRAETAWSTKAGYHIINTPLSAVASSLLRADGLSEDCIPAAVKQYARQHNLYS